jgi:hypothetical protein
MASALPALTLQVLTPSPASQRLQKTKPENQKTSLGATPGRLERRDDISLGLCSFW